jgi:flavin reductase ActVB
MALDASGFRNVMGLLAVGVTVVTTRDRDGRPWGLTATAVCSVSLDPPLILVCVDQQADCYDAFLQAEAFAVNLLREDQAWLSRRFATKGVEKFTGVPHRPGVRGTPILTGALAHVECRVQARHPGGDHIIVVGEAMHADAVSPKAPGVASPLVHFRGQYVRLGPPLSCDPS